MNIQDYAREKGYVLAKFVFKKNNTKYYRLINKSEICYDGDYENFHYPEIGIPYFLVVKNGKVQTKSILDLDVDLPNVNLVKETAEMYKTLYPREFEENKKIYGKKNTEE